MDNILKNSYDVKIFPTYGITGETGLQYDDRSTQFKADLNSYDINNPLIPKIDPSITEAVILASEKKFLQPLLHYIINRNGVVEIRILSKKFGAWGGYFDDPVAAFREIHYIKRDKIPYKQHPRNGEADGIYFALNQFSFDRLSIANNRIIQGGDSSFLHDEQVTKIRYFFVDADARRFEASHDKCNSSHAEKQASLSVIKKVRDWFAGYGIMGVVADSGNGCHFIVPVDYTKDVSLKFAIILKHLAKLFSDEKCQIDEKVYNPARIDKLYGTVACKYDEIPGRPHRISAIKTDILSELSNQDIISKLEGVINFIDETLDTDEVKETEDKDNENKKEEEGTGEHEDIPNILRIRSILTKNNFKFKEVKLDNSTKFIFSKCPIPGHTHDSDGKSMILVRDSGKIGFHCHHKPPEKFGWAELKPYIGWIQEVKKDKENKKEKNRAKVEEKREELKENNGERIMDCYYSVHDRLYAIPVQEGWQIRTEMQASKQLQIWGLNPKVEEDDIASDIDYTLDHIRTTRAVTYCGEIGGYKKGYHDISGEKVLVPQGVSLINPIHGNCDTIQYILRSLLGDTQLPYLYSWLKNSYNQLSTGNLHNAQALAMCGPANSGKTFSINYIVAPVLGGRIGNPYRFLTGKTDFNNDFIGKEIWLIDDECGSSDIHMRLELASGIKVSAGAQQMKIHKKRVDGVSMKLWSRLIICCNDEPENLMVLPPLTHDIHDKIMLFKTSRVEMPHSTTTDEDKSKFRSIINEQIPAFIDFLVNYEIPEELKAGRYGVKYYHHPDIVEAIDSLSPEQKLLRLIYRECFINNKLAWVGHADDLEHELTGDNSNVRYEARKILSWASACSTYLSRLSKTGICSKKHTRTGVEWTITNDGKSTKKDEYEVEEPIVDVSNLF